MDSSRLNAARGGLLHLGSLADSYARGFADRGRTERALNVRFGSEADLSAEPPSGDSYERIHDALKARGFVIYAGQGDLRRRIFRIAHMGTINDEDLRRSIAALRIVFGVH